MSLAEKKILFTYQDLVNWEDDKKQHELIEGDHIVTPSPALNHQKISVRLAHYLFLYVEENDLGEILTAPTDIVLSDIDVLVPDLLFVSNNRKEILQEKYIEGAPDLIIEILSPSSVHYDRMTKFKQYSKYGVLEYWIVDPEKQQVDVFDLKQQELIASFSKKDVLNTPMFGDIDLVLEKIF
jgi:Uma2 family endonuclease